MKKLFLVLFVLSLFFSKGVNAQCTYSVVLYDSYGDGWNGGYIVVNVNGSAVIPYADGYGSGPTTYTFNVNTGDLITISYTPGGWPYENSYYVYDAEGAQIYYSGGPPPSVADLGAATCPSCIKPNTLSASNIDFDSADLTWVPSSTGSMWNIEWGVSGFTQGTGTMVNGLTSAIYNLSGLTEETTYCYYVQTDCGAGDLSSWAGPYCFTTPPSCIQPDWQNAENITFESADLSWSSSSGTLWNIEWGNWWFSPGGGTLVTGLTSANFNLTGLTEETDYGFYVQTDCGGGDVSYWTGPYYFHTPPSCLQPIDLNVTDLTDISATLDWNSQGSETLWNIEYGPTGFTQGTGISLNGIAATYYELTGLSSNTGYEFYVQSDCGSGDYSNWTGPYGFNTLVCDPSVSCSYPVIMYDSWGDGWNGASVSFYQNGVYAGQVSFDYGSESASSIQLCHDAAIELYFNGGSFPGECSFIINFPWGDEICSFWYGSVSGSPFCSFTGDCIPPTCPGPDNLNVDNVLGYSADLIWDETGPASLWNIEWGPAGFTPGTGTLVSGHSSTTLSITGLTPVTGYEFYVQSDCTLGDLSEWEGPFYFTSNVSCPAPSDFQATYYDADEVQLSWTTGSSEHWNIEYGPGGFTPGTGTLLLDVTNPMTIAGLSPETSYDFYVQDSCNIADLSTWVYTGVTTPATCPMPISLTEDYISYDQAVFSWTGFDATEWDIEFGPSPLSFTGVPTIENIAENPYTFSGLNSSTEYAFYIRSDCGAETSEWSGPWYFTTMVSPLSNPSVCEINYPIYNNTCYDLPVNVIDVPGTSLGTDIQLNNVKLIVKHTYAADLDISLESPSGITIELTSDNGSSGDNYGISDGTCSQYTDFNRCVGDPITSGTAPFIGSYIPMGNFDDFNDGTDPNGTWILHICDDKASDVGKLNFLELVFGNEGSDANILSYSVPELYAPAVINEGENTIAITVGSSADLANMVATFTLSPCAVAQISGTDQVSGVTVNDFTSPVVYEVYAEDGTMETWTVTATQAAVNDETDILTYSFPEQISEAVIDYGFHSVFVTVNFEADVYSLFADFTLSYGATAQISGVDQISGITANDFSAPITYTVTAEDGITSQDWTVTVSVAEPPQGAYCENPIGLELPAVNITGTTEGYGDNYGSDVGANPCGSNYLNGNDIVYQIEITNEGVLAGDLTTPNNYAGLFIFDGCPDDPGTSCVFSANSPTTGFSFTDVPITTGTYFVIISSWPSPQYIDFQFNLLFLNNATDATVDMPYELEEICSDAVTTEISMYIVNTGSEVIPAGDTLYPAYQFDGGAVIEEMLILESELNPYDSLLYVFDGTVDISTPGSYPVSLWFEYDNDEILENNLIESFITSYNLDVEIGNGDMIEVIMADFPIDLYLIDSYEIIYWHNSDLTVTGVNDVLSVNDFGWYFVEVTDAEGCFATDSIYVGFTVGVQESEVSDGLVVYPNPGNGEFFTSLRLAEPGDVVLSVRNVQGQLLMIKDISDVVELNTMIDVSKFAPGIYYLEVRTESGIMVEKLVKQ